MRESVVSTKSKTISTGIILFMILGVAFSPFFSIPDGMGPNGLTTIFIIFLGIVLWSTNILPPAITAMIIIVLFSAFNIVSFADAAANLGKEIIWLLISMLIMSKAVEKTALPKRIAYNMFFLAGGSLRLILLFIIFFLFFITFFIPNIVGRIMLILPICIGLINSMKKQNITGIGKIVIPTITFVPVISAFTIITGSGGTLYAIDLFQSLLAYNWGYVEWLIVMMPIGLITVFIYWLVVVLIIYPNLTKVRTNLDFISEEKEKLGTITTQEIYIMLSYIILLSLWITKDIHGFSLAMSAVIMVSTLFLPKINIFSWKEAIDSVEWGIPFVFAAGFSIAQALHNSEVTNWFSVIAIKYLRDLPTFIIVIILITVLAVIRLGFVNNTMMIAAVMPIIISFASGTTINPLWMGMIGLIASFICFILPMQTISNMVTFSLGHHTFKEHLLLGTVMTIILVIVTLINAYFYWPSVGLSIY